MTPQEHLRAIGMIQAEITHRQVAIALNRDHRIIFRLWNRYVWTGTTTDRPRSGRTSVTSARDDQYIAQCALRQRSLNFRRLREQFRVGTNINVFTQTRPCNIQQYFTAVKMFIIRLTFLIFFLFLLKTLIKGTL